MRSWSGEKPCPVAAKTSALQTNTQKSCLLEPKSGLFYGKKDKKYGMDTIFMLIFGTKISAFL